MRDVEGAGIQGVCSLRCCLPGWCINEGERKKRNKREKCSSLGTDHSPEPLTVSVVEWDAVPAAFSPVQTYSPACLAVMTEIMSMLTRSATFFASTPEEPPISSPG